MSLKSRWVAPNAFARLEPIVEHNFRYAGQTGHAGLGAVNSAYIANPSIRQRRSKTIEALAIECEEKRMQHAACLVRQGVWTKWDNVIPFDLSWANLIISFVLNAQINSVRTPDMLKLWGYTEFASYVVQTNVHSTTF